MGKKDSKKNKELKNYIEHLAYDETLNDYSSTFKDDINENNYEEKYKKKFKKLKKLEENMNRAINELNLSKEKYDALVIELTVKREELNRMLELTSTVHKKSKEFLDMQAQIVNNQITSSQMTDDTTLLSNDE